MIIVKVCVIGSGGREHALVWKLGQSPSVTAVYAIPGSDAIASIATVADIDWTDFDKVLEQLNKWHIDLVVIGPEAPLVGGLSDAIRQAGISVFGPSQGASQLEGSKAFAKHLMTEHGIPTAKYAVCTEVNGAKDIVRTWGLPIVIKADGLMAGKGVTVCETFTEAEQVIENLLEECGATIVIEEYMDGEELSFLCFVDGTHVVPMVCAKDHKRLLAGDEGPNTGGMGAYAPVPTVTEELTKQILDTIVYPIVKAMKDRGTPYVGCLYAGLMLTDEGPKVVEFNARFGDPETQVILPLLETDLGRVLYATATGNLGEMTLEWSSQTAVCVMLASQGYPSGSHKGDRMTGDVSTFAEDTLVFHSGTKDVGDATFVTNGGRVLGVVGLGTTLEEARTKAYARVETIQFEGMQYRNDIGFCIHRVY